MLVCFVVAQEGCAQFLARQTLEQADKLNLSVDQSAQLDKLADEMEQHYRICMDPNQTADRDERIVRLREIRKLERARVKEILSISQQRDLKNQLFPKENWSVNAYLTAKSDLSHYKVHLEGYPTEYLSYSIKKANIKLSVLSIDGKSVFSDSPFELPSNMPDVIHPVVDENGVMVCLVDFTFDRQSVCHPGFYRVEFRAIIDAFDVESGKRVNIPDAVTEQSVYLTPQPISSAKLTSGQRFVGTPWEQISGSIETPYKDAATGDPVLWRDIAAKIVTLRQVIPVLGGNKLVFVVEDYPGYVFIETGQAVSDLPNLTPLVEESEASALKAKYIGKQVWCYGGPGAQCVSSEPRMSISLLGSTDTPVRIRHIERIQMPLVSLAIGQATFVGGDRSSSFVTDNPLLVILDKRFAALDFSALSYVGEDGEKLAVEVSSNPEKYCLGLWEMLSDRWDFERSYSLTNPFKAQNKWPKKMQKAVRKGSVVIGMTHEMVAWAIGWPAIYGKKADMLSLNDWKYDNIPSDGHVLFKNGLVVSQEWPSLP